MATDISTRVSIRWLPDDASEPTDTLVYTVGAYFVDLRVLKEDGSIEWGFAGTREVVEREPLKCRWIHTLDSHGSNTPDEGVLTPLPNGDTLETGTMPCPHKNNIPTAYEEIWHTLPPLPGPPHAWILESVDGKSFLGRIAGGFLALGEGEEGFGARREEWDAEGGRWRGRYSIGDVKDLFSFELLGREMLDGEGAWRAGMEVGIGGREYVVRAFEKLE